MANQEKYFLEQITADEKLEDTRNGLLRQIAEAVRGMSASGELLENLKPGGFFTHDFHDDDPVDNRFEDERPNTLGRLIQLFSSMSRDRRPFGRPVGYCGKLDELGEEFLKEVRSREWKTFPRSSYEGTRVNWARVGGPPDVWAINSEGVSGERVLRLDLTNKEDAKFFEMGNVGISYLANGFDRNSGVERFKSSSNPPLVSVLESDVTVEAVDRGIGMSLLYRLIRRR